LLGKLLRFSCRGSGFGNRIFTDGFEYRMIVGSEVATYGSSSMKVSSSKNRLDALNSGGRGDFVKVLGE
jgi:hypothetical protein